MFWSPALESLRDMLMAGKIQELRLAFYQIYLDQEKQSSKAIREFSVIDKLRYPITRSDMDREYAADKDFWEAHGEGVEESVLEAHRKEQRSRWQKVDFDVKRVDEPIGDLDTVLVLTRPPRC